MYKLLLILAIMIGLHTPAEARHASHRHHHTHHRSILRHYNTHSIHRIHAVHSIAAPVTVLPHPNGCPHVAFCGCGASIEVFHENIRRLWVAAEWYSFPRAEPAPGMVAVTRHHVSVLKEHIQGSVWMVIDHNGGHHMSFLHPRSIAGTTIVDPHGSIPHTVHHQERTYRGHHRLVYISNLRRLSASISVHKHSVKRNLRVKSFSQFDLTTRRW